MTFERLTNALSEETPARFAGGRLSRTGEAMRMSIPLERTPLLSDTAAPSEPVRSEPRNQSAALQKAAKPEAKPRLAEREKQKADTEKPSWLSRFLSPILSPVIRNPWLPWRKPKTPEDQAAMEQEHATLLLQTGISAAIVGAIDVIIFFVSHGTIPPVKFLFAVAMLVSTMYLPTLKKKTFISEGFEKNVFGKTWFPWARRKPKTPEEQAKMQSQHKEFLIKMTSGAPMLFLMGMFFPIMTPVRIAWAFGTMAVMNAFAPLKKEAPTVFKSDKRENFVFGRTLMFKKPQTPEEQTKTIQKTKELALSTMLIAASATLARAFEVIPMSPWVYFIPAFPLLMTAIGWTFQRTIAPLWKMFMASRQKQKSVGAKGVSEQNLEEGAKSR